MESASRTDTGALPRVTGNSDLRVDRELSFYRITTLPTAALGQGQDRGSAQRLRSRWAGAPGGKANGLSPPPSAVARAVRSFPFLF